MLQLKNNTPFITGFALFPNLDAIDTLYLMVKATFVIGSQWTLADKQLPIQEADEYNGEPADSSLKLTSDFHIGKTATDILMFGLACSPKQQPVTQMNVGMEVGNLRKTLRVFGDRVWKDGHISSPNPFVNMPIIYERAFGGKDIVDNQIRAAEQRNPVGKSFVGRKSENEFNNQPLPNIEFPNQLIASLGDTPSPAGFGPIAPNWQPRVSIAGTYDQNWQATRAPYLPKDFNPRFLNVAPADQIYSGFLQGGEPVKIVGMHPEGNFQFNLPAVKLTNNVLIKGKDLSSPFNMETLALYPNQKQLTMTWRASIPCDKQSLKIEQITISLSR
jgi:hypothetical protein